MNSAIFKAYDIRGVFPDELDEEAAYLIGQAFVRFTGARTVAVGRDMRLSSPSLDAALVHGLLSQGADVVDLGLVSTPLFYFGVGEYDAHEAGVMVTASHNPKQYNGFKLVRGDASPIGATSGMSELQAIAMAGPYPAAEALGHITTLNILSAYLERLFREVAPADIKPLKVVVDCGNGMAAASVLDVFARLPQVTVQFLYVWPNGNFPNHEANPLKEETLAELKCRVIESHADFGIAFDGDEDRIGFVDEGGCVVAGDVVHALLATELLRREPGATVTYSVNESMIVAEEVERHGGRALRSRIGHGVVKPYLRQVGGILAGELSTHYHFRDFYGSECTDLVALMMMRLVSREGRPFSAIAAPLQRYSHSGEINTPVADAAAVLAKLEARYGVAASAIDRRDGLRFDFYDPANPAEDWWFNVRPSNTEPLLRLTLEAKNLEKMIQKRDEVLSIVKGA